ncbi:pseudaminic acid cytidylyltransferase [Gymnodinialimonas hymeniacidonis]|uniref:pseudaminic acid cytidylyltransferase n=1 Tax=Gymnodinialimonas hymeniacidonis TaxID=3126508 RepID=UPI0034C5D27F
MRRLAVIPARGGSKRVPRKNVLPFLGKPMLAWPIEMLQKTQLFDRIIVTTDDDEIAAAAMAAGADVPFRRPATLSDDFTGTREVIAHAIRAEGAASGSAISDADLVCCVYPTAPFLESSDIARGADLIASGDWRYVLSVCAFDVPVQRAFTLEGDTTQGPVRSLKMLFPDQFQARSQDLPPVYFDAGQFYWGTAAAWQSDEPIFGPQSTAVVLPAERVQDIDTPRDWEVAEAKMRAVLTNKAKFTA